MESPSRVSRLLAALTAIVLLALSGSMAWAAAYEYGTRSIIPQGVEVAGASLGGLDSNQAASVIASAVTEPLTRPVQVEADGRTFEFDPAGAVEVDVASMTAQAFAPRRQASFAARLRHDLGQVPMSVQVRPVYTVDENVLRAWVASVAHKVDTAAVDATVSVTSDEVTLTPSVTGRSTDITASVAAIQAAFESESALSAKDRRVTMKVDEIQPAVSEKDLGHTIVVDLSRRHIWLFDGAALEKEYPCAIGTPAHPTPTGHYEVINKRKWPSWSNPAPNGWGKDMPKYIPPGPGNPLGTRAIDLSASGIRFHGTTKSWSVGTAASHGCMRMYRHDIEDFFERVEVGTNVYIFH